MILRCLVPRTFIDCNRVLDVDSELVHAAGLTGAVPGYVTGKDLQTLRGMHSAYTRAARAGLRVESAALAARPLIFHTYAPRSVNITRIDAGIVRALREAYSPERYTTWPVRPDVDIISEADDDVPLAPRGIVESIRRHYAERWDRGDRERVVSTSSRNAGPSATRSDMRHRVLCIEISRARLADPFAPFEEMTIGADNVTRMTAPIAAALLEDRTASRAR